MKEHVFNMKDPIIVGMEVLEGNLRVGTPLCIPALGGMEIGRVTSIEQVGYEIHPQRPKDKRAVLLVLQIVLFSAALLLLLLALGVVVCRCRRNVRM